MSSVFPYLETTILLPLISVQQWMWWGLRRTVLSRQRFVVSDHKHTTCMTEFRELFLQYRGKPHLAHCAC